MQGSMSSNIINDIIIEVKSTYVEGNSNPVKNRFVFAYTIAITNKGSFDVQLLHRHWLITDANGKIHEVNGEGVVGKQPLIRPGETFRYSSWTAIATPTGVMQGSYHMRSELGEEFNTPVPAFSLAMPSALH